MMMMMMMNPPLTFYSVDTKGRSVYLVVWVNGYTIVVAAVAFQLLC